MFLSEWREFPSAPCLAAKGGGGTWWQLASRCCWNRARPWHASELCFLPESAKDLSAPRVFIKYLFHNAVSFLDDSVLTLGLWRIRIGRCVIYRGAGKSLALPGRKQTNVSVRMPWISFGALLCRKKNLMTARVSMLLKSRASLTCFRACFLPGRPKDLSARRYMNGIPPLRTVIFEMKRPSRTKKYTKSRDRHFEKRI